MVTAGGNQAFAMVALALLDPGDRVLLVRIEFVSWCCCCWLLYWEFVDSHEFLCLMERYLPSHLAQSRAPGWWHMNRSYTLDDAPTR